MHCRSGVALIEGVKTALLAVLVYLCAAPFLLFAGFGLVIMFFANAYLLSREYFLLAAMRFRAAGRGQGDAPRQERQHLHGRPADRAVRLDPDPQLRNAAVRDGDDGACAQAAGGTPRRIDRAEAGVSHGFARRHQRGLARPLAQVGDHAPLAQRPARQAGVAAVQDQPVVRVQHVLLGDHLEQLQLDRQRVLARRQPGAVADAENVGVDRHGRLAERDVEHHVGGLAADAGQRLQRLARARHLAAVLGDELLATAR